MVGTLCLRPAGRDVPGQLVSGRGRDVDDPLVGPAGCGRRRGQGLGELLVEGPLRLRSPGEQLGRTRHQTGRALGRIARVASVEQNQGLGPGAVEPLETRPQVPRADDQSGEGLLRRAPLQVCRDDGARVGAHPVALGRGVVGADPMPAEIDQHVVSGGGLVGQPIQGFQDSCAGGLGAAQREDAVLAESPVVDQRPAQRRHVVSRPFQRVDLGHVDDPGHGHQKRAALRPHCPQGDDHGCQQCQVSCHWSTLI